MPKTSTLLAITTIALLPRGLPGQSLGEQVGRIGALSTPTEEVFGRIADVVVESGTMYVLDDLIGVLRAFTLDGAHIASVGGFGSGPGEFMEELNAFMDDTGAIHVSDGGNVRISEFRLLDDSLHLERDVRTEAFPLESCGMLGRRWILQRGLGEELVHEVDRDGVSLSRLMRKEAPPRELAEIFGGQDHLFYNSLSLACDEPSETVVLMHSGQPIVRAESISGGERWRTGLPGFVQGQYRRTSSGACCMAGIPDPDTGTYSIAWAVVPDGQGRLFITYSEYTRATLEHRYRALVLESGSGEVLAQFPVPGVVRAVSGGRVYVVAEDPFPAILMFTLVG